MKKSSKVTLLPAGLQDLLPPEAAREAVVIERLLARFAAQGYERVKPPMLEFEETLFTGAGAALAKDSLRLMDPVSQRMMALRADMTPQVARIAASRLAGRHRPLRLCYGGQVLRVRGDQLRPARQFAQAGAELIGADREEADAEVVLLAAESLVDIGVAGLSIDLALPPFVGRLAASLGLEQDQIARLRHALDRKDAARVDELAPNNAGLFQGLLRAAGPANTTLDHLDALGLPKSARQELATLRRVASLICEAAPELNLTVDVCEHRGFEYQTGVSFTFFARDVRGELGRGGRYRTSTYDSPPQSSTGFTLYLDSVLRALPRGGARRRIYLPLGTPRAQACSLRNDGWVTIAGLAPAKSIVEEAKRAECSHLFLEGEVRRIDQAEG